MNLISLHKIALSRHRRAACVAMVALASHAAMAQQELPAASEPAAAAAATDSGAPQDKRIMGVLPNYRTADGTVPFKPISTKYKLTIAAKDSFDAPNYVIGGIFAGLYQLQDDHPGFGQGVAGYAHRYGTSYADQVIGNMLTEGFMPVLLHEDPRYFRKVHGSVMGRIGYSLTRVLVTKTDSGRTTFNFAEVVGNGIGSSIANLYYPDERGLGDTGSRMATQIATDALSNLLKEFWPDIKRHLHKRQADGQAVIQPR
jgi:hypothetical protein